MEYHLFTDGSYNPHLDISSMGGYLLDNQNNKIFEFSEKILDKKLLKYHELSALKFGLEKAVSLNVKKLTCYADDISIRNFNELEVLNEHPIDPIKRQLLLDIISLKKDFDLIYFRHIRRNFNKKADKLAEKIQLEHFYDNIFFKERFEIQSQKLLKVPNLLCAEDFYSQQSSKEEIQSTYKIIEDKITQSQLHVLLQLHTDDEINGVAKFYLINSKNNEKELIDLREFDIKKVNSHCLDLLDVCFTKISENQKEKQTLALMIESNHLALKKFEMLLRQRFIFPKIKTPLNERFLKSCTHFTEIIIHDKNLLEPKNISTKKLKK